MNETFRVFRDLSNVWAVAYRNGHNDGLVKAEQAVRDWAAELRADCPGGSGDSTADALDCAANRIGRLLMEKS
jgi:hypothetical protein